MYKNVTEIKHTMQNSSCKSNQVSFILVFGGNQNRHIIKILDSIFDKDSNMGIIPLYYDSQSPHISPIIQKNLTCIIIEDCTFFNMFKSNKSIDKLILVNIDMPYTLSMMQDIDCYTVITYGLKKTAAVTATSIDYGEYTGFNYCLQRVFYSQRGKKIEPFEMPFFIGGLGINSIYAALASISCALYYDIDLSIINKSLKSISYFYN